MGTDRPTRGTGAYHGAIDVNRRHATRTLSKQGNSIGLSIPQPFMRAMNVYPGDTLELIFDFELRGFFVRATRRDELRPDETERLRAVVVESK